MLASTEINTDQMSPYSTVSNLIGSFSDRDHNPSRADRQYPETFESNGSESTQLQSLKVTTPQDKSLNKTLQIINLRTPKEQALKRISDVVENDRILTTKELAAIHHQFSLVSAD